MPCPIIHHNNIRPYKVPLLEPIVKWTEILTKVDSSKSKDYVIAQAKSIVRSVALASMLAISSMRVRISICECEFIHTQRAELSPCPCTTLEQEEALRILVVCDSNRHLFDKEDKKRVAKAKVWIEKHQELARSSRASDVVGKLSARCVRIVTLLSQKSYV